MERRRWTWAGLLFGQVPPIFDGPPTPADLELARDLFRALDDESKDWYRRSSPGLFAGL